MMQYPEDLLSNSGPTWHGVAIGWSSDITANVSPIESTSDRIVGIRILHATGTLLLLSFYAPTAGRDEEFLESISLLTDFLLRNKKPGEQVLIGADCNCSEKSTQRRQRAFHHHNGMSNSGIDIFATSFSLDIASTTQLCTLEDPLNLSSHDHRVHPREGGMGLYQTPKISSLGLTIYL